MALSKQQFRALLAITAALWVLEGLLSSRGDLWLPSDLQAYTSRHHLASISPETAHVIGLAGLLLALVTVAGLFMFWRSARLLAVAFCVVGFIVTPLLGPTVEASWVTVVDQLGAVLFGMVVALAFFSPVSRFFKRTRGSVAEDLK